MRLGWPEVHSGRLRPKAGWFAAGVDSQTAWPLTRPGLLLPSAAQRVYKQCMPNDFEPEPAHEPSEPQRTAHELRRDSMRLAIEIGCDQRTARTWLDGGAVPAITAYAMRAAAKKLGIKRLVP